MLSGKHDLLSRHRKLSDQCKLSIIIPHKDSPDFLERLLATIPDESDLEVIIVDDHSAEPPLITSDMRSNVRIIPNQPERKGAGSARNTGIERANGKWLIFADADDWFLPGAFQLVRDRLNDPVDIIYFSPDARHVSDTARATRQLAYVSLVREFIDEDSDWIRYRFHPPWSKLIRRDLLKKHQIQFDEAPAGDDVLFSLRIGVAAKTVQAHDTPIYCITQGNANALTARINEQIVSARLRVHCRYNQLLRERGLWKYRMTTLPILRKAWRVSPQTFVRVLAFCLYNRQPLFDNWHHMRMLWQRRHGATGAREARQEKSNP